MYFVLFGISYVTTYTLRSWAKYFTGSESFFAAIKFSSSLPSRAVSAVKERSQQSF